MRIFKQSCIMMAVTGIAISIPATAKVTIGESAPAIQAVDSNGNTRTLDEFAGKNVILEWTNHDCPYVRKHYGSNNMQSLQARASTDDVAWLSIISSAPGKQGHVDGDKANQLTQDRGASPTAVLLDSNGSAGQAYGAKTTPHIYVINTDGKIIYQGAIDSNPSAQASTIKGATNYVTAALDAIKTGAPIEVAETQPYGCSVKY